MPTSDFITFAIGLANYGFVLALVAITRILNRKAKQIGETEQLSHRGGKPKQ